MTKRYINRPFTYLLTYLLTYYSTLLLSSVYLSSLQERSQTVVTKAATDTSCDSEQVDSVLSTASLLSVAAVT